MSHGGLAGAPQGRAVSPETGHGVIVRRMAHPVGAARSSSIGVDHDLVRGVPRATERDRARLVAQTKEVADERLGPRLSANWSDSRRFFRNAVAGVPWSPRSWSRHHSSSSVRAACVRMRVD